MKGQGKGNKGKTKKTPNPLKKKIHLPSGEWSWEVGVSGIRVRTPDCEKTVFVERKKLFPDLEMDIDDLVKVPITPAVVKAYIIDKMGG